MVRSPYDLGQFAYNSVKIDIGFEAHVDVRPGHAGAEGGHGPAGEEGGQGPTQPDMVVV